MKKNIIILVFALLIPLSASAKKSIEVFGGSPIPSIGLAIEASYDKRLDGFVPGYKVLNVAVVNESFNIVPLDPQKDKWWIVLKNKNRRIHVIANLRDEDPKAWHSVPERARGLIDYPLAIAIGARQVIDLFVPEKIPLENFTSLIVLFSDFGTVIKVRARQ